MNKHMRFIVTVLFAVILLLTAAITKFYSDTGKSTGEGSAGIDVKKKHDSDPIGNRKFEDSSGLFGVIDSNERVVIDPEWLELEFAGENLCIVSKRLNGKLLTGCIDFEGNVVVPMIYRSIVKQSRGNFTFYTAYPAADDSCILYNEDFVPLFTRSWDDCSINEDEIQLTGSHGTYTYSVDNTGLTLVSAEVEGSAFDCSYTIRINSSLPASLDQDILDEICNASGKYIEYAFTGSREYLSDIRAGEKSVFTTIFPDEKKILSKKLTEITNIYLYPIKSDDGKPHYAVSITAGTEIVYTDDEDKPQTLDDYYKAVIEFCGTSSNDLTMISGSFIQNAPNYPEPPVQENDPEQPEHPEQTES